MKSPRRQPSVFLLWSTLTVSALNILLMSSPRVLAQVQGNLPAFLRLQASTPGTQQTGHANVSGTVIAGQFQGGGAGLTAVDAAKLGGQAPAAYGQVANTNNWAGVNNFSNPLNSFAGSGQLLTGLNAGSLASGTVPDARLTVAGDLTGPLSASTVTRIQGKSVAPTAPSSGQVLGFDGTLWLPVADGLTLPFFAEVGSSGALFQALNDIGHGIRGWSIGGGSGLIGSAGNISATHAGTGVSANTTVPGGYGVFATSFSNGSAGRFSNTVHDVTLAGSQGAIHTDGFLWRDYGGSGPSVAVPIAYGVVSSAGTILSGTGNFAVSKFGTGQYDVTITGETYSNNTFTVTVTPVTNSPRFTGVADAGAGFRVNIWNIGGTLTDNQYQFTVWTTNPATAG